MTTITKTTEIACSIEELFAFHTDSNNIKKITPPNIKVKLLNEDEQLEGSGDNDNFVVVIKIEVEEIPSSNFF